MPDESNGLPPHDGDAPAERAAAPRAPADPTRRQFFRQFAGEVVASAATVVGAVTELRDRSAAEAAVLLGEPPIRGSDGSGPSGAAAATGATPSDDAPVAAVFRTPFRFGSDNELLVIDQRKLPDQLVEMPIRSGSDAATAIRLMVVRGDRAGRGDRARADGAHRREVAAARAARDPGRPGERVARGATDGDQPALGRRSADGPLPRHRRPLDGRGRDRGGDG
jgi:hypothetical protein